MKVADMRRLLDSYAKLAGGTGEREKADALRSFSAALSAYDKSTVGKLVTQVERARAASK
jgi:hypothetical protein